MSTDQQFIVRTLPQDLHRLDRTGGRPLETDPAGWELYCNPAHREWKEMYASVEAKQGAAAERERTVRHLNSEAERLEVDGFKSAARHFRLFAKDLAGGMLELRDARRDEDIRFVERERIRVELLAEADLADERAERAYAAGSDRPGGPVNQAASSALRDFARRLERP